MKVNLPATHLNTSRYYLCLLKTKRLAKLHLTATILSKLKELTSPTPEPTLKLKKKNNFSVSRPGRTSHLMNKKTLLEKHGTVIYLRISQKLNWLSPAWYFKKKKVKRALCLAQAQSKMRILLARIKWKIRLLNAVAPLRKITA